MFRLRAQNSGSYLMPLWEFGFVRLQVVWRKIGCCVVFAQSQRRSVEFSTNNRESVEALAKQSITAALSCSPHTVECYDLRSWASSAIFSLRYCKPAHINLPCSVR